MAYSSYPFKPPPLEEDKAKTHTIDSLLEEEYSLEMEAHLKRHANIVNMLTAQKEEHLNKYRNTYDKLREDFTDALCKMDSMFIGYLGNADADSFILDRYEDLAVRDFVKYAQGLGYDATNSEEWVHTVDKIM